MHSSIQDQKLFCYERTLEVSYTQTHTHTYTHTTRARSERIKKIKDIYIEYMRDDQTREVYKRGICIKSRDRERLISINATERCILYINIKNIFFSENRISHHTRDSLNLFMCVLLCVNYLWFHWPLCCNVKLGPYYITKDLSVDAAVLQFLIAQL